MFVEHISHLFSAFNNSEFIQKQRGINVHGTSPFNSWQLCVLSRHPVARLEIFTAMKIQIVECHAIPTWPPETLASYRVITQRHNLEDYDMNLQTHGG